MLIFAYLLRPRHLSSLLRLASLLPIIWFSYRFGIVGAITSATLINALIIVEAIITDKASNTYISQLFILANAITSMVLGAAITELKSKNVELKKLTEHSLSSLIKTRALQLKWLPFKKMNVNTFHKSYTMNLAKT
ncbi:hypothetical protein P4S68_20600 [Pseudoalteromonas sp. Hal099]